MLLAMVLGLAGMATVAVPARADRNEHCEKRIRKAEKNLRHAIDRHGENSRQAHKRREQLESARRGP